MTVTAASDLSLGTKVSSTINNVNKRTPALAAIPTVPASNPAGPRWNFEYGEGTVAAHAESAGFPDGSDSTIVSANLGWGTYHTAVELSDEAVAQAMIGSPDEMKALAMRKINQRLNDHWKKMQNGVFQGAGSNNIIGFGEAVSDSNTYAGINQGSVTDFGSVVNTQNDSKTTLTKTIMRSFITSVLERGNLNESDYAILCIKAVEDQLVGLYEGQVRFDNQLMLGGVKPHVSFDGIPVISVPLSDGYVSTETAETGSLLLVPINWESPKQGVHMEIGGYDPNDPDLAIKDKPLPFGAQVVKEGRTAHARKWVVRTRTQLVVPNPGVCGKLTNIAIA